MLTFEAMHPSTATMYLMDALGRTVWQSSSLIHAGGNVDVSFPYVSEGLYYFVLSTDYGQEYIQFKSNR